MSSFLVFSLMRLFGWKPHLLELSRKLARSVGIFYKLRHYIPLDTLKSVYYALFYPFLTYGITVWGTTSETYLKLVQITQKKVVRAITFSNLTAHSLPLFSNLKLLKVDDLYKLSISSFVYECHSNLASTHFTDYFTQISAVHSYTRGAAHGDYFIVRKSTLVYRIRSICFNGAKIWNSIPPEIRDSPSVWNFRKRLKKLLLGSYKLTD